MHAATAQYGKAIELAEPTDWETRLDVCDSLVILHPDGGMTLPPDLAFIACQREACVLGKYPEGAHRGPAASFPGVSPVWFDAATLGRYYERADRMSG